MPDSTKLRRRWTNNEIVIFPTAILAEKLSPTALRLWIALAQFANDKRQCFPSRRKLLELMPEGTAKTSLRRARGELEKANLLEVEYRKDPRNGRDTTPLYTLLVPINKGVETDPDEEDNTVPLVGDETVPPINLINEHNQKEEPNLVEKVFEKWVEATEKHPKRTKLDEKRRSVIRKALKTHSFEDVCDAVIGWKREPFYCGQNDRNAIYNSLNLLLRDAEHIEKFRDLEREATLVIEKPKPHVSNPDLVGMVIKDTDGSEIAKYDSEEGKWNYDI